MYIYVYIYIYIHVYWHQSVLKSQKVLRLEAGILASHCLCFSFPLCSIIWIKSSKWGPKQKRQKIEHDDVLWYDDPDNPLCTRSALTMAKLELEKLPDIVQRLTKGARLPLRSNLFCPLLCVSACYPHFFSHTHTHTYIHIYIYIQCTYLPTYLPTCIHTCMHAYIHTYIHTH